MFFYHFTDSRNLPSIKMRGLMSWKRLLSAGVVHWPASNDLSRDLDERVNLGNYVRLCLQPEHPMAYRAQKDGRIRDVVWLQVDGAVARWSATKFSSDNATSSRAVVDGKLETALQSRSNQAEVLVEGGINPRWIKFPGEWVYTVGF